MKGEQEVREILINNTIHLIAEGGFEKATTKAITYSDYTPHEFKLNEVYIYRLFGDKDHLYAAAFETLDNEFLSALNRCFKTFLDADLTTKGKLYQGFIWVWNFLFKREDRCRCYIRYYYSVYFHNQSIERHKANFAGIVESFGRLFKEEADTGAIMHSVLTTLLEFIVRVFNGELENSLENKKYIFNVLFSSMSIFFKDELKEKINN